MSDDDSWKEFTKDVSRPLKHDKVAIEKPKPDAVLRSEKTEDGAVRKGGRLAERLYEILKLKQARNLVSHVYKNLGIGAPPISGGKIEGKKRTRRW